MSNPTLLDDLRVWVGGVGFRLFLWSIRMTQNQYLDLIGRDYVVRKKFE